jgi:hypothetical protein
MATTETGAPVVRVQHRGRLWQIFRAPWADKGDHLHIQDLDGGPGQIVPLDHPVAKELLTWHPEVAALPATPNTKPAQVETPGAAPAAAPIDYDQLAAAMLRLSAPAAPPAPPAV